MPPKTEVRFAADGWQSLDFHVRAVEDGDGMTFEGYAAVFNMDSDGPIPGFGIERIMPGAFKRSLGMSRDIKMFLNHNDDLLLASREAGTLELVEDDIGLKSRARFIDTTVGTDTAKNVAAGNVRTMSFGFNPVAKGMERVKREDGQAGTDHHEVALWEVSPVTSWPAYSATSASVRHLTLLAETDPEEFEHEARQIMEKLPPERLTFLRDFFNKHSESPLLSPESVAIASKTQAHASELEAIGKRLGLA